MNNSKIIVRYDDDADVLYLALGAPVPASTDEDDNGLLVRYALSDGHPCGVTIMGFQEWKGDIRRLSSLIGEHLHVAATAVGRALPH